MLHRLRWGDVKGTGKKQLVVAPLQGRGTKGPNWGEGQGVRVLVFDVPADPAAKSWPSEIADDSLHTIHNLQLVDLDGDHRDEIVLACWEGVFRSRPQERRQVDEDPARLGQPGVDAVQGGQRGEGRADGLRISLHRHDRALARLSGRRLHAFRRRTVSGTARSSPSPCSGATPSGSRTSTATRTTS